MVLTLEAAAWQACAERSPIIPKPRRWASPLDMACDLDPTMVRTPALECINAALVDLAEGRLSGNKLAIFMPPQEGKSTLASYWNPLWILCELSPDTRIICVSYSDEMARRWGADVKLAVETHNGDEDTVDLGLRLRSDSRAAGRWQVADRKGGIYCAGVAGKITGKPADYIGMDDPLKNMEESPVRGVPVEGHADLAVGADPRMGPTTKVVWIQTLWHESEPIQQILGGEGAKDWKVIRIPAVADSPDDPLGRAIGEPLRSARGHRDWAAIRRDVGAYVFAALYQQRPAPAEGNMFKRLWWRYWTPAAQLGMTSPRIDLGGRVILLGDCWRFGTVDLAASAKTSADWTVISAWALTPDRQLVLLDRTRVRVGEAEHFSAARPLVEQWQLDALFVEKSQHGTTLVKEATNAGVPINPLDADTDKVTRALPASAWASNGRIWLPAGAWWLKAWLDEHAGFPNASHDDQVDTLSYAVRVAVTQWAPRSQQLMNAPPAQPSEPTGPADGPEIDFMNQPM